MMGEETPQHAPPLFIAVHRWQQAYVDADGSER